MRNAERKKLWAKHLEVWMESGLTQRAYCERESLSYDGFKRWRRRLQGKGGKSNAAARFVPIRVQSEPIPGPQMQAAVGKDTGGRGVSRDVEVRLVSGRSVVLGGMFDEVELGRLIRLLEVLPC